MMENKDIAKFLYDQRIAREKPIENPDGESLALLELYEEINALGYDFHYLADIDLRPTKDVRVMRLLWKYLPQMESFFTIETFIRRIAPKKIPEVLDYAMNMFSSFSPSDKMLLTGFDEVISKGKRSEEYYGQISRMLKDGDSYATLWATRKILGKYCPELLYLHTKTYRDGVLLPLTLRDCVFYDDKDTTAFLNRCLHITDEELVEIIGTYDYKEKLYKYQISVTIFEYWKKLCTKEYVQKEAKRILHERSKNLGATIDENKKSDSFAL